MRLRAPRIARLRPFAALPAAMSVLVALGMTLLVAPSAHAAERAHTVLGSDGETVSWFLPDEIAYGEAITIRGTGWQLPDDSAGSVISVLINAPNGAAPTNGAPVLTTRSVSGADGSLLGDKRLHAQVRADADGNWSATIPFPTPENSDLAAPWGPGETHGIRVLTGSGTPGDTARSSFGTFVIAGQEPEPEPEPEPGDHVGKEHTYADDPSVRYWAPESLAVGDDIVLSGTGWTTNSGAGSVIGVLLDAGQSGDPNTLFTTRNVLDPTTGKVSDDKRQHAIVQVADNGDWQVRVPFPTAANAKKADGSPPNWTPGSTHQVRLLTGSLGDNDKTRSTNATFTIAGEPEEPDDPTAPPSWSHVAVTAGDATAWVERTVNVSSGSTIRIKGTGWTNPATRRGSTIALKLNGPRDRQQYKRSGSGVIDHPSASADATIWALLAPDGSENQDHVFDISDAGDFEIAIDAPRGLEAGQLLSVQFQSGLFASGDPSRSATSPNLLVGGRPYTGGGGGQQNVTCRPSTARPSVTVAAQASIGGKLSVSGTGWCHPGAKRGGSVIAIKIDEGGFSHLTDAVHSNRTIWAIVDADGATGDWEIELQLPDGTGRTSTPAFGQGAHTLRLLTGTLKDGDTARTVKSDEFVVGAYRPNGAPPPVDAAGLNASNANNVTVTRSASSLRVTVPGLSAGDWIYATPYLANGSPRFVFPDWVRATRDGSVDFSLSGVSLPTGNLKVVVQSGNQGAFGVTLGWGGLHVPGPPALQGASNQGGSPAANTPSRRAPTTARPSRFRAASPPASPAPRQVPQAPVAFAADLTRANAGTITAVQEGTLMTLTLPDLEPGAWVFLFIYEGPLPVGWVQLDAAQQVKLDVAPLPPGEHKVAAVDVEGALVGWVPLTVDGAKPAAPENAPAERAVATSSDGAESRFGSDDVWLLGGALVATLAMVGAGLYVRLRRV